MESEESGVSKNSVFELMAKRDRERKLVIEKNQRERQNKSELEGVDYFESMFDKKVCDIENRLTALQPSIDAVQLQEDFTSIANDLQEVQKYFTSSTIFLSDHKIKTSQHVINQLILKCDETKSRLIPKKKFGFKNKAAATAKVTKAETKVDGLSKEKTEFLWTDSKKQNEVLRFSGNGQDLTFKEMKSCAIFIDGYSGSIQMSKMKNCLVMCGAVSRSVFADNCENCVFAIACQQLRLHSSSECSIYIQVTSRAIIEDCKSVHFAPNTYPYANFEENLKSAGLDVSVNNWEDVGDFNWLSTDKPSPNWSRIKEDERISNWEEFIDNFTKSHEMSSQ
jgi:hypothetical protein